MFDIISGVVILLCCLATANEMPKNVTIEELEKQKSELYKQINIAIDESVKSLLQTNDTEAKYGLNYMRDLKEHIKALNETDNSTEDKEIDVDTKSDLESRRKIQRGIPFIKFSRKPKGDPFDFATMLKPKRISESEWKDIIENRQKMQQKLDLWLMERAKEKERLKKLRQDKLMLIMSGKYEKCPRFGYYGKKKREKKGRQKRIKPCRVEFNITAGKEYDKCPIPDVAEVPTDKERKKKMKQSDKNKYPCCRKCCKKSYMGCL